MFNSAGSVREAGMWNDRTRTASVGVLQNQTEMCHSTGHLPVQQVDHEPTTKSLMKRYWPILVITWILHFGLGLSISITGPTLPYLALNTDQSLSSAGLMYTFRSIIVCITCISTGIAIAKLQSSRSKLLLLLIGSLIGMLSSLLTPYMRSAALLIVAQCLFGIGAGMVDTVNNMLVIYLFGPLKSRSFSHSLHLCVGVGGFIAPLMARPFLEQMGDAGSDGSICGTNSATDVAVNATIINLQPLKWPFLIIGCFHAVWICGYVVLLLMNFQLDRYCTSSSEPEEEKAKAAADEASTLGAAMSVRRKAAVVILFILFFIMHVGQENTFWSHLFSFGVCSKLDMSPGEASMLSFVFFIGFLASRVLGIVIAKLLSPAKILVSQLLGCLLATSVLAIWGEHSHTVAYIASAIYGFCIAMVFPTGITWLASKIDVTGSLSSTWFIGAYIGNATYPLAAGALIQSAAGAISMMYLAAGTSVAYMIILVAMLILAK